MQLLTPTDWESSQIFLGKFSECSWNEAVRRSTTTSVDYVPSVRGSRTKLYALLYCILRMRIRVAHATIQLLTHR